MNPIWETKYEGFATESELGMLYTVWTFYKINAFMCLAMSFLFKSTFLLSLAFIYFRLGKILEYMIWHCGNRCLCSCTASFKVLRMTMPLVSVKSLVPHAIITMSGDGNFPRWLSSFLPRVSTCIPPSLFHTISTWCKPKLEGRCLDARCSAALLTMLSPTTHTMVVFAPKIRSNNTG
jgi:hypothetical protein